MKWMMQGMKIASALKPVSGTGGGALHSGIMSPEMKAVIKHLQTHGPGSLDRSGLSPVYKIPK